MKTVSHATHKPRKFWSSLELVRTYQANHRRCKLIKAKCNIIFGHGKLKQVRQYKDLKTGDKTITVEIDFEGM